MRGHAYPEEDAVDTVVARLQGIPEYRSLFAEAFEGENTVRRRKSRQGAGRFSTRPDREQIRPTTATMRGETDAMTRLQIQGMRRFEQVGCINCHNGPMFSDYELHVLGIRDNRLLAESDSGAIEQPYAFRTPSLRNLAYTAPYMHNGLFATLEDVVEFYDDVGDRDERNVNLDRSQIDPLIRTLDDPDDHERELIAFLNALNDDVFDRKIPDRVPSGLSPGGGI